MKEKNDNRLIASYELYSNLAQTKLDKQELVGRSPTISVNDEQIFFDITKKLQVKKGNSVFVVGVGCGEVCDLWIKLALKLNLQLYLNDFPPVVNKIRKEILPKYEFKKQYPILIEGIFPAEVTKKLSGVKFDCIDIYSVIHYTDFPEKIIDDAVSFLMNGGRCLIGDIPNLSKKGRFLSSRAGRDFEAKYRNKTIDEIPIYQNHRDFVEFSLANGAPKIDDDFIFSVMRKFRESGHDVYALCQPTSLPFCHTREDILIVANYE